MALDDRRDDRMAGRDQPCGRLAHGVEPGLADLRVGVRVGAGEVDHAVTSSAAIRSAFLPVKFS